MARGVARNAIRAHGDVLDVMCSGSQGTLNSEKGDTGLCGHPVPPRRRQNSFFARSFGSSGRRGHRYGAVDVVRWWSLRKHTRDASRRLDRRNY